MYKKCTHTYYLIKESQKWQRYVHKDGHGHTIPNSTKQETEQMSHWFCNYRTFRQKNTQQSLNVMTQTHTYGNVKVSRTHCEVKKQFAKLNGPKRVLS